MISAEDKLLIHELIARNGQYADYGDWKGLETTYAPSIVTEMEGIPIKYEGISAQVEHAKESHQQTESKNRNYMFNIYISEEGEDVVANYCFINVNAGGAPMAAKIVVSGRQRDTVVRTGDGWKIGRRYVTFDQSFDLDF
jgi:hypothetical protein